MENGWLSNGYAPKRGGIETNIFHKLAETHIMIVRDSISTTAHVQHAYQCSIYTPPKSNAGTFNIISPVRRFHAR